MLTPSRKCAFASAPEPLSWRRPKFTDWYIDLDNRSYHVHKGVLGDGARKSEYFSKSFGDQTNGTTKLDAVLPVD